MVFLKLVCRLILRSAPVLAFAPLWGCSLLPDIAHQPTLHNPFPQLSKVAVAPFFNLSSEPTVDGRQVALAYQNELQLVPGFEVVPVGVVERAMQDYKVALSGPQEARRLAQMLGVDAVVIGAVTDFTPYYPPRCGLQVEWYAANPGFHPIPPGYGLPWGTPEEKEIPAPLVFEAEFALAKEQLKTQSPNCGSPIMADGGMASAPSAPSPEGPWTAPPPTATEATASPPNLLPPHPTASDSASLPVGGVPGPPPGWPDPRGFVPPPPSPQPPTCWPSDAPVLKHMQTYNGHDVEFTEALASYYFFRDDARFGGWQSYLQRSDDFIRFCCHMHIWEMLGARGGAGETRVVWRCSGVR